MSHSVNQSMNPSRDSSPRHFFLFPLLLALPLNPVQHPTWTSPHQDLEQKGDTHVSFSRPWLSRVFRPSRAFNEVLPSWNVDVPKGAGIRVELQVGDPDSWSPWLHIGDWGRLPPAERRLRFAKGRVAIDIFRSKQLFTRARFRLTAFPPSAADSLPRTRPSKTSKPKTAIQKTFPTLHRLHVCFSNTLRGIHPKPLSRRPKKPPLTVPLLRQGSAPKSISSLVCSPTSVTMVLRSLGKPVSLVEAARGIFDPHNKLYGVWNRAVQYAWTKGVPGYLTRIASWDRVLQLTEAGHPIIISIAFEKGQLRNSAFSRSDGHLIVLLGLRSDGQKVLVADPGTGPKESIRRAYFREDLSKCWMQRGGYSYVLGK